tara:strand:- start:169 stop:540 length:372 start_codon:yes stop_codon:yes gene_type:complete
MKNKIMHELPENIKTRIRSKLNYLASVKQTITYKEMVDECDIPQPFSIRKLTNFLSELMIEEIKLKLPIKSSLVVSKSNSINEIKIPSKEFFKLAKENGIYDGNIEGLQSLRFYKRILHKVFE